VYNQYSFFLLRKPCHDFAFSTLHFNIRCNSVAFVWRRGTFPVFTVSAEVWKPSELLLSTPWHYPF